MSTWSHVPDAPVHEKRVPLLVPFLVVVIPMAAQLRLYAWPSGDQLACAVVVGVLLVAMRVWPPGLPLYVLAASAAIVGVLGFDFGWHVAVVTVVPAGFWAIATGSTDPPYRWVPEGRLFRFSLVPLVVNALLQYRTFGLAWPQRSVALACLLALPVVLAPRVADRAITAVEHLLAPVTRPLAGVSAFLGRAGHAIGEAIGTVLMVPVAVVVSIAWAFQRLVRYDPLRPLGAEGTRWVRRSGSDPEPRRLFSGTARIGLRPDGDPLRRLAAGLLSVAVIGGAIALLAFPDGRNSALSTAAGQIPFVRTTCGSGPDPAMENDPGWPDVLCETGDFSFNGRFDAVSTYTMADYESENVNVTDGVRKVWRAPDCGDCRRVSMWMFGGSAAFGWWQSDDYTIASQLAQKAWEEDAVALDIEVRAMPGWVIGQEVRTFGNLSVTEGQELPDVAMFYDGGNDLHRQNYRNDVGRGADGSETSYAEEELDELLRDGPFPWRPGEVNLNDDDDRGERLGPRALADVAMDRYLRGVELGERLAEAAGVEALFVWQPLLPSAGVQAGNPDALPADQFEHWEAMLDVALPRLPDEVLDLSDVLDDVDGPVFKDLFHHNVEASGIIADALYDEYGEQFRELADG